MNHPAQANFAKKQQQKNTRQEKFPIGVYFLCKCICSGRKGETTPPRHSPAPHIVEKEL